MISANDHIVPEGEKYLTIEQAHEDLRSLGFDVTLRQVQRYAFERKLPFFTFGKKLHIQRKELRHHFTKLQLSAVREIAKAA